MIYHSRRALIISGSYLVLGLLYILTSGTVAEMIASDVISLAHIERVKGIVFIVTTAIALFWFASWQLKAITRDATELLDHRDMLLASERQAIAATFAVATAHRLRNELGPGAWEKVRWSRDAGMRIIAGEKKRIDLSAIIQSSIEIARLHGVVRNCKINFTGCSSLMVDAYPAIIHPMIVNLLINSAEVTGGQGKIEVHLRNDGPSDTGEVVVEVHDSGPGIPVDEREMVFQPFFTTKRNGLGFGLLSVHACVEAHGGRVEVFSSHLGGARFDIIFPGVIRA